MPSVLTASIGVVAVTTLAWGVEPSCTPVFTDVVTASDVVVVNGHGTVGD